MAGRWTEEMEAVLLAEYGKASEADLARRLGKTRCAVWCRAAKLGLLRPYRVQVWTEQMDRYLRERYDGRVRGRVGEIAGVLGVTHETTKYRAERLGLTRPDKRNRRMWTEEEKAFLLRWAGERTPWWMARQLKRSRSSVVEKMRRENLRTRIQSGYTQKELMECFGTSATMLRRWERLGMLSVQRGSEAIGLRAWRVSEEAVLEFVQRYPMELDLGRVDQFWFMDLILDGGLVKKALAAEAELEAA